MESEKEENGVGKTATGWRATMPTGAVTAKSERRFSENNLRPRKKSRRTVRGGEREREKERPLSKSHASPFTHGLAEAIFRNINSGFRVTHTICPLVSPTRRETPLKQPALRCRPFFLSFISFFFFFTL